VRASRLVIISIILFALSFFPYGASGQSGTGSPAFGSIQSGGFDSINLQNLNVGFGVPIVSHPGRGIGFQYNLAYNSLVATRGLDANSNPIWTFLSNWQLLGPLGSTSSQTIHPCPTQLGATVTFHYTYTDSMGTSHPFPVESSFPAISCTGSILTGYATDASGYYMDLSRGVVISPDGIEYNLKPVNNLDANGNIISITNGHIVDPNGNQITSTTQISDTPPITIGETDWTDTLGQTVLKVVSLPNGPSGQTSEIDYERLAVDGTYQTIALKYTFASIQTAYGCAGVAESAGSGVQLVSEIDLSNGQKYSFSYEPTPGTSGSVTGRLQQVTLPSGGSITYSYPGPNGGIDCSTGAPLQMVRTVSDGTTPETWSYSRVISGGITTTTVTAPPLPYDNNVPNQTVITFDPTSQLETNRKIYQGSASGSPVQTVNTAWTHIVGNLNYTPQSKTVILEDGSTQSEVETTYDTNGMLQVMKEHDWGSGAPGPVLRTTTLSYLAGSGYTTQNIINRVTRKVVTDASGAPKYRIDTNYDEANAINAICVSGLLQHDDTNYGCSYATRGLPTSVITYTDAATPSGGITRNFSYDSLGNLVATGVNSVQQQQYNFSTATQYAFPDSVATGPAGNQLTTSATYNVTTGQIASATDANQKTTSYAYNDPGHLDRLTDVQRPDNLHITTGYDDLHNTVTVKSPLQGADVIQKVTAFDLLGRPVATSVEDTTGNVFSATATQYDVMGRPYMSSNPYTTSPQFWTTNQFDALGRPTITQLPDGSQSSTSYATNSITSTDPAGKQKLAVSDGLGHMVRVDEPGDSSKGMKAQ
jgi:YD repeat-containing protein